MRTGLSVGLILLSLNVAASSAGEPSRAHRNGESVDPVVKAVLREAGELAPSQGEHQRFWSAGLLLYIGDLQIRAGDFDGALRSIRGSGNTYCRVSGLRDLADALARAGKRESAFDVLRLVDADNGDRPDYLIDGVQMKWIEHLIISGDLDQAGKAIEQMKSNRYRPAGLRNLAVAYAQRGDAARAAKQFSRALDAASDSSNDFERAQALWQIADAQLSVGRADAAKETIRRLLETVELQDPWAKFSALRECAVLFARANDEQAARRLFQRATDAHTAVHRDNKLDALRQTAVAQAGVGYIDDALKTAWMIKHSEDFSHDCPREEALYAIAVAQLKGNDTEGAVRTALSVKYFDQYRDDALRAVVDYQLARQDLKAALATSGKIDNPSRKASAILKVATAYAKSGDRKTATDLAARIELTNHDDSLGILGIKERFDYRLPRSWGICYDARSFSTMASIQMWNQRAAEVAAAAMTFSQALGQKPAQSYAVLFNDIDTQEVIRALARAQAASSAPNEDLSWANNIGSNGKDWAALVIAVQGSLSWAEQISRSGKVNVNDYRHDWAVERRLHALIGVAEGILDR